MAMARDPAVVVACGTVRALPSLPPTVKYSCRNFSLEMVQAVDIPTPERPAHSNHSSKQSQRSDRWRDRLAPAHRANCPAQLETPFRMRADFGLPPALYATPTDREREIH